MKKYLTILLFFVFYYTNAQIDNNRPENTVRYQNIHFVVDQSAASVGVATVEKKHNKSLELFKTALLTDIRVRDLHIILRADNDYTATITGKSGRSDLYDFGKWVHNPVNNCDFRDMQAFATGTSGGGILAGDAFGHLYHSFAVCCLYHSPRNGITLAHEWSHSVNANNHHFEAISCFKVTRVYDFNNPPICFPYWDVIASAGWSSAEAGPFFSTPLEFNASSISNGGNGYFVVNKYNENGDYYAHIDIPVEKMDNINDPANDRKKNSHSANSLAVDSRTVNGLAQTNDIIDWCSVEDYDKTKSVSRFTNTTTGILYHYKKHIDYLRTEEVAKLTTPEITLINDKINVINLSDYTLKFPNTTNTSYQDLYYSKGDYQVFVYESSNTSEGSQIAGPIPLGQIIVGLPVNKYVVRVYEAWSNSLSDASSLVALGTNIVEINNFSVYPNPTTSILNIRSSEEINNIIIYNQLGEIVKTDRTSSNIIDISNLSNGIYFLNAESEKGHKSIRKIIKE